MPRCLPHPVQALVTIEAARGLIDSLCTSVRREVECDRASAAFRAWERQRESFSSLSRARLRSRAVWQQGATQLLPQLQAYARQAAELRAAELAAPSHELLLPTARVLALRACANPMCTNTAGSSEARLRGRRCSRCRVTRFCSTECAAAAWGLHRWVCGVLAAAQREGELVPM